MTRHVLHGGIHRPHVDVRLVASAGVLLAAAIAGGVLVGRSTRTAAAPTEGVSEQVARMFDAKLAALNRGDWKAFGAFWAGDAILEEPTSQMYAKGGACKLPRLPSAYDIGSLATGDQDPLRHGGRLLGPAPDPR